LAAAIQVLPQEWHLVEPQKKVLIIDDGKPCNSQTPFSHNCITNDGKKPGEIAYLAKRQVLLYDTIQFLDSNASVGYKIKNDFQIETSLGETFTAKKLIFATGVKTRYCL